MFFLFYVEQSIPKSFKNISFITIYINFNLKFIHLIICLQILDYLFFLSDFYILTVSSKLKDHNIKFIVFTLQNRFPRLFSSFQYLIVIAYRYILYITVYIICSF